jgi:hypothetical protein
VKKYSPVILEVLKKTKISARQACGCIGICEWKPPLLHRLPLYSALNTTLLLEFQKKNFENQRKQDTSSADEDEMYYFGHFTDVHMDLDYLETAEAECADPICCRADSHHGDEELHRQAGPFGDYRCDLPLSSTLKALRALKNFKARDSKGIFSKNLEFVLFSGDILPHDIWEQDEIHVYRYLKVFKNLLVKEFQGLPVFSAIGNHESAPPNLYMPKCLNATAMSWLYAAYADTFPTLPEGAKAQMRHAGYYSTLIKPGLRLITLNNNIAYAFNLWLYIDIFEQDPDGHLHWLVSELQEAEMRQEAVYILGHEPPGAYDTLATWAIQYERIVVRFSHIIKGQFFGHTHHDHFQIFYDELPIDAMASGESDGARPLTKKPRNIAWITPAITTFVEMNPAFRVFAASKRDHSIQKIYTFTMDFSAYSAGGAKEAPRCPLLCPARKEGNGPEREREGHQMVSLECGNTFEESRQYEFLRGPASEPCFELSYEMAEAYKLASLDAEEMHELTERMKSNSQLFHRFHANYYKKTKGHIPQCLDRCRQRLICQLQHAVFDFSCGISLQPSFKQQRRNTQK